MRKVKVYHWKKKEDKSAFQKCSYEKVEVGIAKFHQFGFDYEDTDMGVGTFSTAIVEWDDGSVENVSVEMVQFVDQGN